MSVQVDFINGGQGTGAGAEMLANGLSVNMMRPYIGKNGKTYVAHFKGGDAKDPKNYKAIEVNTNATLRRDEWKHLDEAVLMEAKNRLIGISDLESRGLVYNIGDGLGSTVLETHRSLGGHTADMTMDGNPKSQNNRMAYDTKYLPLPIIHVDYSINSRVLAASRKLGRPLDTSEAEEAARAVSEKLEDLLFTATTYKYNGGTIYSYLNHPDRNQVTLSVNWDASAKTAAGILADVLNMKQALINKNHYGPFVVYVPTAYETILDEDYDATTPGQSIRERLLKIDKIEAIKVADHLTDDNVIMVQMQKSTVRLVKGMAMQNVEWTSNGKFTTNYKVMTIQVPQIRSDKAGNCGIAHLA